MTWSLGDTSYLTSPPNQAAAYHTEHAKPSLKKTSAPAAQKEEEEVEEEEQESEPVEESAAAEESEEAAAPAASEESAAPASEQSQEEGDSEDKPTPEAVKDGVQVAKTKQQSKPKDVHEANKASVQEVSSDSVTSGSCQLLSDAMSSRPLSTMPRRQRRKRRKRTNRYTVEQTVRPRLGAEKRDTMASRIELRLQASLSSYNNILLLQIDGVINCSTRCTVSDDGATSDL